MQRKSPLSFFNNSKITEFWVSSRNDCGACFSWPAACDLEKNGFEEKGYAIIEVITDKTGSYKLCYAHSTCIVHSES